ncbi:MAG: glycoside hydrolase family 99-like domain-containing protein [Verrucomicrobiae bacterium]|nr:glycoside hydrolase family 99-like domain-containing protein [Verrucomicrobiae bacterium]
MAPWLPGAVAHAASGAVETSPIHVSAYYYPWYSDTGRHWNLGYAGKERGDGPELGRYSSRSPETIRQHLEWSEEFGIANWICSWWGPGSWEDETMLRHVVPEIEAQNAANPGLPQTFCLLYESEGILGLDSARGIEFDLRRAADFAEHFRHLAREYFAHPAYYRIGGKPVVYLYLSRTFSGDYVTALSRARAVVEAQGFSLFLVGDEVYWGAPDRRRIQAFDAITSYNMHGPAEFSASHDWSDFVARSGDVFARYRSLAAEEGVGFVPGIIPGFNAGGGNRENPYYVIPRVLKPGASSVSFLKAQGAMAKEHLDSRLRSVAITSFNEWHEGTQVEPNRTLGKGAGAALRRLFETPTS